MIDAVHGVADVRRHPQPVGPPPHARRVERRLGRRGRRRAGAAPRSAPTAAARSASRPAAAGCSASSPSAAASRRRRMQEPWHGLSVYGAAHPPRRRHRAASRRHPATASRSPPRPRPRARQAADRDLDRRRPADLASPDARAARRARRHGASCCATSATRSASAEIHYGTHRHRASSPATCAASPTRPRKLPHPERLSRRTRGFRRIGQRDPERRARAGARRGGRQRRARSPPSSSDADVVMTPMFTRRPMPIGTYEGRGALWSFNGYSRWVPYCAPFNHTGQPAASVPAGFTGDGFPLAVQLVAPPRRRGDAALARRPARGRAAWARPRRRRAVTRCASSPRRSPARRARSCARRSRPTLRIETKSSPTDLVSEADDAAEKLIRERLLAARPDDGMLGEEGRDTRGSSGLRWVVDPLDGTTNFLFGDPAVGGLDRGRGRAGHARRRRLRPDARRAVGRRARRAADARRRGRSTVASTRASSPTALVATGFGYDAEVRAAQAEISGRAAPARARHPPHGLGRDRPRVDRRGPLRRLLRARHQDVGLRRGRADLRVAPGSR